MLKSAAWMADNGAVEILPRKGAAVTSAAPVSYLPFHTVQLLRSQNNKRCRDKKAEIYRGDAVVCC